MKYLLDTNICIYMFKGQYGLPERIRTVGFDELIFGAKSNRVGQNLAVVNEFAQNTTILPIFTALDLYGREKARLKLLG